MKMIRSKWGRLLHGDCLDLMFAIPAGRVDMVFLDVPYGVTDAWWDVLLPFDKLWEGLRHVGHENTVYIFSSTFPFTVDVVNANRKEFKHRWIWDKVLQSTGLHVKVKPLPIVEDITVFCCGRATYNPQMVRVKRRKQVVASFTPTNHSGGKTRGESMQDNKGLVYPKDILTFAQKRSGTINSTQKAVGLLEYLIATYSNPGDLILDPTAGSGTTAVAAINTRRKYVCIEKDGEMFDAMCNRIRFREGENRLSDEND